MTGPNPTDPEARLEAEVDRAVARYAGKVPPYVLAKLRTLAERFYRENAGAARALRLADEAARKQSGNETTAPDANGAAGEATEGRKS